MEASMSSSEGEVPEEARKEVASAVRIALAKHGYADLTTSQIAKETEKSEAFLFYHYDTKDDLVTAFLEDSIGWLDMRLKLTADELETPDDRLRALCDIMLALDSPRAMQGIHIAVMELLSHAPHNETLQEPLRVHQDYVRDRLAEEVRAGIEQGIYRDDVDPEAVASFLQMTLDGSTGSVLSLRMEDVGREIQEKVHSYIDGLRREGE
jgi:AcrR family transcriptional regulator